MRHNRWPPRVGLYASVAIAMVIAFTGGRPGMIRPQPPPVAVLVIPLAAADGVLLSGIFFARLGR